MKSIGLLFGSFNPPHNGHLWLSQLAQQQTQWRALYWILTPCSPARQNDPELIEFEHRWELLKRILRHNSFAKPCGIERQLEKPQYTLNTLKLITNKYPDYQFELLVGEDTLRDMPKWHQAEQLRKWPIWVASRPHPNSHPTQHLPFTQMKLIHYLKGNPCPISASDVRHHLRQNKPVQTLIPKAVHRYIQKHQLYQ